MSTIEASGSVCILYHSLTRNNVLERWGSHNNTDKNPYKHGKYTKEKRISESTSTRATCIARKSCGNHHSIFQNASQRTVQIDRRSLVRGMPQSVHSNYDRVLDG